MLKHLLILMGLMAFSGAALAQSQGSGGSEGHPVNDSLKAGGGVGEDEKKGGGAKVTVNPPGGLPTVLAGGGPKGQEQRVPRPLSP
jgi:hypothetical protein